MEPVIDYYERYREEDRLTTNNARRLEFLTTVRAFDALLPAGADILDCAAGAGVYAHHLAGQGHRVTATDLSPRNIQVLRQSLEGKPYAIRTDVLDATDLSSFADGQFDVVLNMGPFYHLVEAARREQCLRECLRVLRPGGLLATAYISRFSVFPHVSLADRRFLRTDLAGQLLETGVSRHGEETCFWTDTYYAAPDEMEALYRRYGLALVDHFAQDGLAPLLRQTVDQLTPEEFAVWRDYHYATCRERSLLGASNHLLLIGRKA